MQGNYPRSLVHLEWIYLGTFEAPLTACAHICPASFANLIVFTSPHALASPYPFCTSLSIPCLFLPLSFFLGAIPSPRIFFSSSHLLFAQLNQPRRLDLSLKKKNQKRNLSPAVYLLPLFICYLKELIFLSLSCPGHLVYLLRISHKLPHITEWLRTKLW